MRTRTKLLTLAAAAAISASAAGAAFAHHSFAMFDNSKTVTMTGAVSEFEWLNPHVWLHITTSGEDGREIVWSFEAGSTGQLRQTGWSEESVHAGDEIQVAFHPLKDGSNGGQLLEITKSDGTYLCQGGDCRERMNANN
jgi:hypothetical protein